MELIWVNVVYINNYGVYKKSGKIIVLYILIMNKQIMELIWINVVYINNYGVYKKPRAAGTHRSFATRVSQFKLSDFTGEYFKGFEML